MFLIWIFKAISGFMSSHLIIKISFIHVYIIFSVVCKINLIALRTVSNFTKECIYNFFSNK